MKCILLTGFMASGKTTLARMASQKFKLQMHDTDELVEAFTGKAISTIFSENGEKAFRKYENQVFAELLASQKDDFIVSTGGGLLLNKVNQSLLSEQIIVFVDTDFSVIQERLLHEVQIRPIAKKLSAKELLELFQTRRKNYLSLADFVVKTTKDFEDILKKIMQMDTKQ